MKKYFTLAAVATMFAACTSEELAPAVDAMTDKPVTVSGADITSATTRNETNTTPLTEGSLGLYFDTPNVEDTKYDAENREVTYTEGKWVISGTPLLWINAGTDVSYTAYYPYNANGYSTITVPTNQNEEGEFTKADFLYGSGTAKAGDNNGAINITLAHQMSKLTVTFNITDEVEDATIHSVTIDGCLVSRMFDASATENKWGTVETNAATTVVRMSEAEESSYKCIILPQDATNHTINVALTQGDKERVFKHTLTSQGFESNKAYTLTLKLGRDATAVGTVQVEEWDTTEPLKTDEMAEANGYTYDETQKTFIVNTAEGLQEVMNLVNGTNSRANSEDYKNADITLGADIILPTVAEGESNLTPISEYSGTFDGAGYSIKGLTVVGQKLSTEPYGFGGIVNKLNKGTIQNLTLTDCTIAMDVTGSDYIGGFAGDNLRGTIKNCHISGNSKISGNRWVGGIVGRMANQDGKEDTEQGNNATIEKCTIKGNVTVMGKSSDVGGIVSFAYAYNSTNNVTINDCHVSDGVKVTGSYAVGGIVSEIAYKGVVMSDCTVKNNVVIETTSATEYAVGGVAGGVNSGAIAKNCVVDNCTVTAAGRRAGGIAGGTYTGSSTGSGIIMGCKALNTTVTGAYYVGGLVGENKAILIASYSENIKLKQTNQDAQYANTTGGIVGVNVYKGDVTPYNKVIACYTYNCTYDGTAFTGDNAFKNVVDNYNFTTDKNSWKTWADAFEDTYYYSSATEATPVTTTAEGVASSGTAIEWSAAVAKMNDAITSWNTGKENDAPDYCNYQWGGASNATATLQKL